MKFLTKCLDALGAIFAVFIVGFLVLGVTYFSSKLLEACLKSNDLIINVLGILFFSATIPGSIILSWLLFKG